MNENSDSGDACDRDTQSDKNSKSPRLEPELLLYELLHDEILSRISYHSKSLLTGLSVIGFITGYSLLSEQLIFLSLIPIVIGFLTVEAIRQYNSILFISSYLCEIEDKYKDNNPLFAWEYEYGLTGTERHVRQHGVNWSIIPSIIILIFAILGYGVSIYLGFSVWPTDGIETFIGKVTRARLLLLYGLLTILVLFAGYSYHLHLNELRPKKDEAEGG